MGWCYAPGGWADRDEPGMVGSACARIAIAIRASDADLSVDYYNMVPRPITSSENLPNPLRFGNRDITKLRHSQSPWRLTFVKLYNALRSNLTRRSNSWLLYPKMS